jgi:hypothetical protein
VVIATAASPRKNWSASVRRSTTPVLDQASVSTAVPTCAPPSQIV